MARLEFAGSTPGTALYLRKSSEKQGEYSLPAQERHNRAYHATRADAPPIVAVYIDVLSGRRADRNDYQRMLADARAGRVKVLIFHKANRFGRDAAEALLAARELMTIGVEIRIADMPALDIRTPEGRLLWGFLLVQGEFEVANLGREVIKGMREKVAHGGWAWRAPDGYANAHVVDAQGRAHATIVVDPVRAAVVRLISMAYASGRHSLSSLVRALNRLDAPRRATASRCAPWGVKALYDVLTNPFMLGEVRVRAWNVQVAGGHPVILQRATWDRVQAVLRAHGHVQRQRHTYLLANRIVGDDETPRSCTTIQRGARTYSYYFAIASNGQRSYWPTDPIDSHVRQAIRDAMTALGTDLAAAIPHRLTRRVRARQAAWRTGRAQLAEERQRLLHHARRGTFTDTEIDDELNRIAHARDVLERATVIQQQMDAAVQTVAAELVATAQAASAIDRASVEEQCALVELLIERVRIDAVGAVTHIHWTPVWHELIGQGATDDMPME